MTITETTLEMHFHRPLMELFRSTFGLGNGGALNFFKYSPQKECFVGFDQAYVRTQLSVGDFFSALRSASTTRNYQLNLGDRFLGYFLQFKVVHVMQKRMRTTPPQIRNRPHYRVDLDTKKKTQSNLSQHELLFSLRRNAGAFVYYACPMLFHRDDLYNFDVDLDTLRLADLATCPGPYTDNSPHYIYFNDASASPIWLSEPQEGTAISPETFAQAARGALINTTPQASREALLRVFDELGAAADFPYYVDPMRAKLSAVHESLTIIRWSPEAQPHEATRSRPA